MYIESLKISNLRCFKNTRINFQYPGLGNGSEISPNVNLLLGDNGAGKSTVLRAIALATLSPVIQRSGYVPYYEVRYNSEAATIDAEIILHREDLGEFLESESLFETVTTHISKIGDYEEVESFTKTSEAWKQIFNDQSPGFFVVGYSTTRRVESGDFSPSSLRKQRRMRYQRVAGLFEENLALIPISTWMPEVSEMQPQRFEELVALINNLLYDDPFSKNHSTQITGEMEKGEYIFLMGGIPVPFSALSDGYRKYISWIGDLIYHLHSSCPNDMKLIDLPGIVLLDEIDLHLHPEWQRFVIGTISRTFPNLQFIFTSHSPIVTGTLETKNIFLMEPGPEGDSIVRQLEENVYGLTAEQILLSSYFNLETTRAPGFEDDLEEITKKAWKGDIDAAVEYLTKLSGESE